MSQQLQSDVGQKQFSVGRGLLAAAETLNYNMNEQRSSQQMGGMASGMLRSSGDGPDGGASMARRGGASNLGSTMKLFASLGLTPDDLDALVEIPEDEISVETLPRILMQLKSRKMDTGDRGQTSSMSSEAVYRGGRDSWDEGPVGRMSGPSMGQGSSRAQTPANFGFGSMQDVSSGRGFGSVYSSNRRGDQSFPELSHQASYGGPSMGSSSSGSGFMQQRMGSPSTGKIQDFLGVMPLMFPHVCTLCDFDVHSSLDWNQHVNGLRHAESKRLLLDMYPEWEPRMASSRSMGLRETPNLSAGLLGPGPMSSGQTGGGMPTSWGGGPTKFGNQMEQNMFRSRVVVVKYEKRPSNNKTLFAFTEPFGRMVEHLVLNNKAFMEMSSHEEALDMVNYYKQRPASLYGKPLNFYLSNRLLVIEKDHRAPDRSTNRPMDRSMHQLKGYGGRVVFFSHLPREEEKKKELLTIAGRFGTVEKHLFLIDGAFIQMGTPQDAGMLVKYYTINPLNLYGRQVRLNICTKYKTLTVNNRQHESGGDEQSKRNSRNCSASSSSRSLSSKSPAKVKAQKEEDIAEPSEEEGVSAAMQEEEKDDERTEKPKQGEKKEAEPERAEPVKEIKEEEKAEAPAADDVATDAPAEKEKADEPAKEPEVQNNPAEIKKEPNTEPEESSEAAEEELPEDMGEEDFMENMENFVTLDELEEEDEDAESDTIDNTRKGGMRVVNIVGFRRGYNFFNELLGLAKPFGKVTRHLVLDLRPEAYIQFETEEEARDMARFYNGNVTPLVCGRPVRISHSMTYPTIRCGTSRVVYVGQLPNCKYADEEILKLAEPYGKVRKYFLNRIRRECFIEMHRAEDAEKMAEACKADLPRFNGKRLTIYVSRKYRQLKHGHRWPSAPKRESSSPLRLPEKVDEPPAKKIKEEQEVDGKEKNNESGNISIEESKTEDESKTENESKTEDDLKTKDDSETKEDAKLTEDVNTEEEESDEKLLEDPDETEINEDEMDTCEKQLEAPPPEDKPWSLPPFDPNSPIGVEHVKMGYFCRVCFLFYSNKETAIKIHCSSQSHYDNLQKYLEKEHNKEMAKKTT